MFSDYANAMMRNGYGDTLRGADTGGAGRVGLAYLHGESTDADVEPYVRFLMMAGYGPAETLCVPRISMEEQGMSASEVKEKEVFAAADRCDENVDHEDAVKAAFYASAAADGRLSAVIGAAVQDGVKRDLIVSWGVECGFSEGWVRQKVSACFIQAGQRVRKSGAGAKRDPRAEELAAYAAEHFGADAAKLCRSAAAFLKKQDA